METPAVKAQRLLEQLHKAKKNEEDDVPFGYLCVKGWGKLWKMGRTNTERNIKMLVKRKLLKCIRLRRFIGNKIHVINFYG
jgi:hypothetical protein